MTPLEFYLITFVGVLVGVVGGSVTGTVAWRRQRIAETAVEDLREAG